MGKVRSIETGDATGGARLEYVKSRRMLRLSAWGTGGAEVPPLEVPAASLLDELGVGPAEIGATPVYLVLAGLQDHPARALRHVAAAYTSELQARQAFRRLRAEHHLPDEWGQVVALDARCRLEPLCWFGKPGELSDRPASAVDAGAGPGADIPADDEAEPPRARRWGPRRMRA